MGDLKVMEEAQKKIKNAHPYPNQKTIYILPKEGYKKNFTLIKNEVLFFAVKDLNKIALFLWFYFCCFLNSSMELHQGKICKELNISAQSYYNGLLELNKKNYLVTDGENSLKFFALPYDFLKKKEENESSLGVTEYSKKQNKIFEGNLYKRQIGEKGKENVYSSFLNQQLIDKIKNLSYGGFIMWIYLNTLMTGSFFLSQSVVSNTMSLGRWQYLEGVNELIEKGFLIEQRNNIYNFNPNIYLKKEEEEEREIQENASWKNSCNNLEEYFLPKRQIKSRE